MMRRDTRILFFTVGVTPTEEEQALAAKLTNNIGFRNASVSAVGAVERADGVAALDHDLIPGNYIEAYPTVSSKAEVDALDKEIAAAEKAGTARPVGTGVPSLDNGPTGPANRSGSRGRGRNKNPAASEPENAGGENNPALVTPTGATAGANDASQTFNNPLSPPLVTPATAMGATNDGLPSGTNPAPDANAPVVPPVPPSTPPAGGWNVPPSTPPAGGWNPNQQ